MRLVTAAIFDRDFRASWLAFAVAALPGVAGSAWATLRLAPALEAVDLVEWVLLGTILTVLGSLSQLGLKPGYMQEVTDRGEAARHPALRAAALALAATGALAGLIAAAGLALLAEFGLWRNVEVLWWLPLGSLLGNLAMIFHTDLRILGQPRLIAVLSIIGLPVLILTLEAGLRLGLAPLAALWAATCLVTLIFVVVLAYRSGVFTHRDIDRQFLTRAVTMGVPVMGGLLAKYVADLAVAATFRWWADEEVAKLYGLAMRAIEPFFALVIGAFQMAWGAHVYGWLREAGDGSKAAERARQATNLGVWGLPLGLATGVAMLLLAGEGGEIGHALPFLMMALSRALAFGMASPMGFGQTMRRDYRQGMRITVLEMLLTVSALPFFAATLGSFAALGAAALLPWLSVALLHRYSRSVLNATATLRHV